MNIKMDTAQSKLNGTSIRSTLNGIKNKIISRSNKTLSKSKQKSHCRAFKDTVNEYASSSSAHGMAYIFELGRLPLERVFWIFGVGFALVFR